MNKNTSEFLDRIFNRTNTKWWHNLVSETPKKKYGESARFLESTLQEELSEFPDYRRGNRSLYFFSKSSRSSIDGRYHSLGVEEKFNPLDLKEHLIDGAIHRGIVWTMGKLQNTQEPLEAVSLYVVKKDSAPMDQTTTDIYIPILTEITKIGVYVVFVNEETGEFWYSNFPHDSSDLPSWLSSQPKPSTWNLGLDQLGEKHDNAFSILKDEHTLKNLPSRQLTLPNMGKAGQYKEYSIGDSSKVAVMDYGNQWRLIELGFLLRALGYDAVKVIYNKTAQPQRRGIKINRREKRHTKEF